MNLTDRPDMTMSVYHAVAVMQEISQRNKHYKYNTTKSVLYMSHYDNFSPINKSSLEKVIHILFVEKRGPIIYLAELKKEWGVRGGGGARHSARTFVLCRI